MRFIVTLMLMAVGARVQSRAALDDIVGVWQSDTTNGTSARSTCAPTPAGGAVLCEQAINTPAGIRHALNLFTVDSAGGGYVFYNVSRAGDPMNPVRLAIANHVWVYGGVARGGDGKFHRTVNDFSTPGSYSWRVETSADSVQWVAGPHGVSRRVR